MYQISVLIVVGIVSVSLPGVLNISQPEVADENGETYVAGAEPKRQLFAGGDGQSRMGFDIGQDCIQPWRKKRHDLPDHLWLESTSICCIYGVSTQISLTPVK